MPYTDYDKYDLGTIEEYQTVTVEGVTVDIPGNLHNDPDHKSEYDSINDLYRRTYFSDEKDLQKSDCMVMFMEKFEMDINDLTDDLKKRYPKEYRSLLRKLGKKQIGDIYEFYDVLYSLDEIDSKKLSENEFTLYAELMVYRQILSSDDKHIYRFENDSCRGFVKDWSKEDAIGYVVEIYPKKKPSESYSVLLKTPDEETAYKIINSIRINTGE